MRSKILIFSLALLAALAVAPALAEVDRGWRYSYVYSFRMGGKSVSGTASLEVVEVFEDGSVRLRFESSFNDGIAVVEKNMPAHAFNIPRIPWEDPSGSLTYTRHGVSYTLTVLETGRGERTVGSIPEAKDVSVRLGTKTAGIFLDLENRGLLLDCAVGVEVVGDPGGITLRAELHRTLMENNVMKMVKVYKVCVNPLSTVRMRGAEGEG